MIIHITYYDTETTTIILHPVVSHSLSNKRIIFIDMYKYTYIYIIHKYMYTSTIPVYIYIDVIQVIWSDTDFS